MKLPLLSVSSRMRRIALYVLIAMLSLSAFLLSQRHWIREGAESYVYGYPLVLMDITHQNFVRSIGPDNQLTHAKRFPDADFRDVVRLNVDTLYSFAWLDLSKSAMLFDVPASERYYVMQFLDAWTNVFASIGPRTTGTQAGQFLLVGPQWTGEVPPGVKLMRSPTRLAWLIGRVQTNGAVDYPAVHAIQQQFHLTPLDEWKQGKRAASSFMNKQPVKLTPPLFQMRELKAQDFFQRLLTLLKENPPVQADQGAVQKLDHLGIKLAQPVPEWNAWQRGLIQLGMWMAGRKMQAAVNEEKTLHAGWRMPPMEIGRYGQDYGLRATVAMLGLGANLAADAVYPSAQQDGHGQQLRGDKQYRLHFAAGQLPPAKAFWSVTAYDGDSFLIHNPLKRYALGDRDHLQYNADGSLDIYMQANPPVEALRSNWLPIPEQGNFGLTARIYWPKSEVLVGKWQMPGILLVGE